MIADKIAFLNEKLAEEKKLHSVEHDLMSGYARELQGLIDKLFEARPELSVVKNEEPAANGKGAPTQEERDEEGKEIKLHQRIAQQTEPANEEDPEAILEAEPAKPVMKIEATEEILIKKKVAVKQQKAEQVSLNERFRNETTPVSEKLKAKKKNLKEIFDLNERFTIIQKLFKGSSDRFNHFIHEAGRCASRDEAQVLISNAEVKFSWNENAELAETFRVKVMSLIQ